VSSPEEALAHLSHKIAKTYRAMADLAASDPARISEPKAQYARLAEEEEIAARALLSMAAFHQKMASPPVQSPVSSTGTKSPNYGDSAFRR